MRLLWWQRERCPSQDSDHVDDSFDHAMQLADEVKTKIRERANSPHPFRQVLIDLLIRPQAVVDPVLVADAYEMTQEAHIFRGPPNGHG